MRFDSMHEAKEHYEKLMNKNYQTYQECGESKYYDAFTRYEMIVDAMTAYLDQKDERDHDKMCRRNNIRAYIDQHMYDKNRTYTHDEVVRMLEMVGEW